MKTISTQQEVLVITGTSFSLRQWTEKNNTGSLPESAREELEKACWNGLIKELLPEIFEKTEDGEELFLWQICEANAFIELDFSEYPGVTEKLFSINPYLFMQEKNYN
ncbi:MAG: hypothetical protein JST75_17520 [Bacteroidetes bacterium]|nr:hypothetical protein [Bacteroidota bacterium]